MRVYANFDTAGRPLGFYNDDIYPDAVTYGPAPEPSEADPQPVAPETARTRNAAIPAAAVEITEAQWQDLIGNQGARRWDGQAVVPYVPPPLPVAVPDSPTLGDWRVGLVLWSRTDANGVATDRLTDVMNAVNELVAAGNPMGVVARERLEYSNNVLRAELMQLKDAFGFTEADVDESLWRADCVRQGDLTGVWPTPAAT